MTPPTSALLTDLYQLTMLQAYFDEGMEERAVFEFFVRKLPPQRNFLLCAGLDVLLDYLEGFHFTDDEIAWLSTLGSRFRPEFLDWLARLRFSGDVYAMAEGTPFFADEPIVRVEAPIAQAQVVESLLINLLHYQTVVASKAARCVLAGQGRQLVDFGLRRAHGGDAGLYAARASYLAGFDGSATVEAGHRYGVPLFGTMAHSYIQAHEREQEAFLHFAHSLPGSVTLLIDTYDTVTAAGKVAELVPKLRASGIEVKAVRLDSGDLAEQSVLVRRVLDGAGCRHVRIFCSGSLDEYELARLLGSGAPIDGFGIGTRLVVPDDVPFLDCAYKLQAYAGRPRRKRSAGKATWPGAKQVFRSVDQEGRAIGDTVALVGEDLPGTPLLVPVMRGGVRLSPRQPLAVMRQQTLEQLERLPAHLKQLDPTPEPYPVHFTSVLQSLVAELDQQAH